MNLQHLPRIIGDFPKWNRNSVNSANSRNLINNISMKCGKFKDPVSHMCLAGTMVASWSLTQEVAGLNSFTAMTFILVTEFSDFNEKIYGKLNCWS